MPTVYSDVEGLDGSAKVVSHPCTALRQHCSGMSPTRHWREGAKVLGHAEAFSVIE